MRNKLVLGAALAAGMLLGVQQSAMAQTAPPGYTGPTGSVPLNPAHQGTEGSEFTQDCTNAVPPPAPGGVLWHFILPQSVLEFAAGGTPGNIFATMVVTFETGGQVTVTVPAFGPPSGAHAWVYTDTDDTLLNGVTTIFRENTLLRSNESSFNLSHTCFVPAQETTTTTTTTPVGTTTTTVAGGTTTTVAGGTTTTVAGEATTTTIAGRVTTTSASTGGAGGGATTTVHSGLPVTGSENGIAVVVALVALALGVLMTMLARRRA